MKLFVRLLCCLVLTQGTALWAQPGETSVEALRNSARERVKRMERQFQEAFKTSIRDLAAPASVRNTERIAEAETELARWVGAFSAEMLGALDQATNELVITRLSQILAKKGGPSVILSLVERADSERPKKALLILKSLHAASKPGQASGDQLAKKVAKAYAAAPALQAEAIWLLAKSGHPEAPSLARARIAHPHSVLRVACISALARSTDDPREDAKLIISRALEDSDISARAAAARALGNFPDSFDAQRTLNDIIEASDKREVLSAALDAVAKSGSRERSARALKKVVANVSVATDVRERAARILYAFGDPDGIELLVKPEALEAKRNARRFQQHKNLGDAYFRLGAYAEALKSYRTARKKDRNREPELHIPSARCLARLGKFKEAERELESAGYTDRWSRFRLDPDFEEMRQDPRYEDRFKRR